jgi:hypothetical protein
MFVTTLRVLAGLVFGVWASLTLLVLFFVVDRLTNPGQKSISDADLIDYGKISLVMLGVAGLLLFISSRINATAGKD